MRILKPASFIRFKSWQQLENECNAEGLTSLVCRQDFASTKEDSFKDNGWTEQSEADWKQDTMCRMLAENLDFGRYNETTAELENNDSTHSAFMGLRNAILENVAFAWIFYDNGLDPRNPDYKGNKVFDLKSAQIMTDELVAEYDVRDFMPRTVRV